MDSSLADTFPPRARLSFNAPVIEPNPVTLSGLLTAAAIYVGFFAALFAASIVLPGKRVMGFAQPDGQRKHYKVNGMSLWVATHIAVVAGHLLLDVSPSILIHEFWSLLVVTNVFSAVWAVVLWRSGRRKLSAEERKPLTPMRFIAELWYGVELNPTFMGVDLKVFAYQPSLIGLGVLNVGFAFVQYEQTGALTPQMIAYQTFWWLYLTTHYYFEVGVLSMWDVIAEKFGFMLVWGDLALVTFFYCIGGWYLLGAEPMAWSTVGVLAALHLAGLLIFRGSNAQKDQFKRHPERKIWGKNPETIGGRLLISGWWGIGRKINYTGELMVYFSFALCSGFGSAVPYLLPLWLCVLLPHRAWRDEKRCHEKYGELWERYTQQAKFRMIPFVY